MGGVAIKHTDRFIPRNRFEMDRIDPQHLVTAWIRRHGHAMRDGHAAIDRNLGRFAPIPGRDRLQAALGFGHHLGKLTGQRLVPRLVFGFLPLLAPGNRQWRVVIVAAVDHDLLLRNARLLMNRFHNAIVVLEIESQQIVGDNREFSFAVGEHQRANIERIVCSVTLLHRPDQKGAFGRDVGHRFCRPCRPGRFGIFTGSGLRLRKRHGSGTGTGDLGKGAAVKFGFFHGEPFWIDRAFDVVRLQFNTNGQSMTKGRSPCTAKQGNGRIFFAGFRAANSLFCPRFPLDQMRFDLFRPFLTEVPLMHRFVLSFFAIFFASALGAETWTQLDYPGSTLTTITAISGERIVGWYRDDNHNPYQSFLYENGTWDTLEYPGASKTVVYGN